MEAKLEIFQEVTLKLNLLEAVLLREILNEEQVTLGTPVAQMAWDLWECMDNLLEDQPGQVKNPLIRKAEEYIEEKRNT